jgi:hypothetical protein
MLVLLECNNALFRILVMVIAIVFKHAPAESLQVWPEKQIPSAPNLPDVQELLSQYPATCL